MRAPPPKTLPQRIRYARGKRGLTQRDLAISAGLSNAYVSKLERADAVFGAGFGESIEAPKAATLERLAGALGCSPAWLAFGLGRPCWIVKPARAA